MHTDSMQTRVSLRVLGDEAEEQTLWKEVDVQVDGVPVVQTGHQTRRPQGASPVDPFHTSEGESQGQGFGPSVVRRSRQRHPHHDPWLGILQEAGDEGVEEHKAGAGAEDEMKCANCTLDASVERCDKHGTDWLSFKCRFCCKLSVWYCFAGTHFCEGCHNNWSELVSSDNINKKKLHSYTQCSGLRDRINGVMSDVHLSNAEKEKIVKSMSSDPETCPLRMRHPPNGTEYSSGCGMCVEEKQKKESEAEEKAKAEKKNKDEEREKKEKAEAEADAKKKKDAEEKKEGEVKKEEGEVKKQEGEVKKQEEDVKKECRID